jgi:hypothetical protein
MDATSSLKGYTVNHNSRPERLLIPVIAAILIAFAVPAAAVDIPDSPEGTARAVGNALADRHPEVLWQALPPTYQKDITEVTHAFAAKMDPAVWDAAFGVGRKTAALLRDKKDIILASSTFQAAGDKSDEVESGWEPMVSLLDSFFASDVSSLEKLKTIDWEKYLSTTGRDLMNLAAEKSKASGDDAFDREFVQALKQTEIEVVSRDGDTATLRMTAPGEEPEEEQFTRVEGRWVPSEMATEWDQNVAEARQKIAAITDEEIQQGSMQAMMMIGMVDGVLTQLQAVETAEEFDQSLQAIIGPFLGGMMGAEEEVFDDSDDSEEPEIE